MNTTLETIYNLRSIHGGFSEQDITDKDFKMILEACTHAANASARQSYSIIAVNNKKVIKEQFSYGGNKAILFCVDFNRIIASAKFLGREFKPDGLVSFITASTDTVLAAQTAAIAAKSIGIDSLFTNSVHRNDLKKLYETFKLPEKYCFPIIALILGYSGGESGILKGRLKGKGIIHENEYCELNDNDLNEINLNYNDTEKHIGLIDNWRDLGFSNYLDWFYTAWCKNASKEKQEELFSFLQDKGFINGEQVEINENNT